MLTGVRVQTVMKVGELRSFTVPDKLGMSSKTKNVITFVMQDDSSSIAVTVWGDHAHKYQKLLKLSNVISVKNAQPKVREKSGTNLPRLTLCSSVAGEVEVGNRGYFVV